MSFLKVTDDIELHPPNVELASIVFALVEKNRTYLQHWLPWVEGTKTIADSKRFLRDATRYNNGGQQFNTIIVYKGEIVGLMGYNAIVKKHGKGEIGYWLSEDRQGLGIVTQACQLLIRYGFKRLKLNKIVIRVATHNTRSSAIPKRLGFTHEGTLRDDMKVYEQFVDMEMYGLLKKDTQ